jgi:ABC-type transport system involved in multi-copper enzyme maturation permease subunit
MALVFVVMAIQHGGNPAHYGPAGGRVNYENDIAFAGLMAFVAGAIIGGTAGTQDLESGVFRDLAATGRSRAALFASRAVGAAIVVMAITGLTAAFTGAASVALAGSLPAPGAGSLIAGTLGVVVTAALSTAIAVGLSVVVASRGPVIGIQLAFYLAVSPLLVGMTFLGNARQAIPEIAVRRIADLRPEADVRVALLTAVVVVIAWAAAALGLGAWRTKAREI